MKKLPRIEIINTCKGVSVGARTKVLINGVEITGITKLNYNVAAGDIAVLTLELLGDISLDVEADKIDIHESRYSVMKKSKTKTITLKKGK